MNRTVNKCRLDKIIFCGTIVEYIEYGNPISVEPRKHSIIKNKNTFEGKREDNLFRARSKIRHTIWTNQTRYTKFLTLTYTETCLDINQLMYDFKQFIKKVRRRGYSVPYLYVTEHQKNRGLKEGNAGSLHIHAVLFTDDFIPVKVLSDCWAKGFVKINVIDNVNNLGAYVCKYLTKEEFEEYHKHSYHISRGLLKPLEICNDGYIGDYSRFDNDRSEMLKYVKFTYENVQEFTYKDRDNFVHNNYFIYRQGHLI